MFKPMRFAWLTILLLLTAACDQDPTQPSPPPIESAPSEAAAERENVPDVSPSQAGHNASLICPADYLMTRPTQYGGHATQAACNAAATAPTPCTPYAAADPGCVAYCKNNWWPCVAGFRNPAEVAGSCYPLQSGTWAYSCVEQADCHCV